MGDQAIVQFIPVAIPKAAQAMNMHFHKSQGLLVTVDFYPECLRKGIKAHQQGARDTSPEFANFSTLIQQANYWLGANPQFRPIRCESVTHLTDLKGTVDLMKSTRHEPAIGMRIFVRCLRLWCMHDPMQQQPASIWYFNVFPRYMGKEPQTGKPLLEGWTLTLNEINKTLQTIPLPGRILNMEHLLVNLDDWTGGYMDMDRSYWFTATTTYSYFGLALRVFYIQGPPTPHRIGIVNFLPRTQVISGKSKVQFESMEEVLVRAMEWILKNKQHRITDIQTLSIPEKVLFQTVNLLPIPALPKVTEDDTVFTECFQEPMNHINTLRVAFVCDQGSPLQSNSVSSFLFAPGKVGTAIYESIQATLLRVQDWLNTTQSPLLTLETVDIDHSFQWDTIRSSDMNHEVVPKTGLQKLTCYRLYFDGAIPPPPVSVLAPIISKPKSSTCTLL